MNKQRELTTKQRIALVKNMEKLEQQIQEEGGFTWKELVEKCEKDTINLIPDKTNT